MPDVTEHGSNSVWQPGFEPLPTRKEPTTYRTHTNLCSVENFNLIPYRWDFDCAIHSVDEALSSFRKVVPESTVTTQRLIKLAQHAIQGGVAKLTREVSIEVYPGIHINIRRVWEPDAHNAECTVVPLDRALKFCDTFTRYSNNSCAIEATLFMCRSMRLTLKRGDAMPVSYLLDLPGPERELRTYMALPHDTASPEEAALDFERFQQALVDDPGCDYEFIGDTTSPNDILAWVLPNHGTTAFTTSDRWLCCNGVELLRPGDLSSRQKMITITLATLTNVADPFSPIFRRHPNRTLGEVVGDYFRHETEKESNLTADRTSILARLTPCPKGDECEQVYRKFRRWLDGPTIELVVSLGWGSPLVDGFRNHFNEITFTAVVGETVAKSRLVTVTYQVCTSSIVKPAKRAKKRANQEEDHFIGRTKNLRNHRGVISQHDGLDGPEVTEWVDWETGLRPEDRLVTLMLRLINVSYAKSPEM